MYRAGKELGRDVILAVDDGRYLSKVWGRKDSENERGVFYKYRAGGDDRLVAIGHDAVPRYEAVPFDPFLQQGKRDFPVYLVRNGEGHGFGLDGSGTRLSQDEIAALVLSGTVVKLHKSLSGGGLPWKWIVVGVVIVTALVIGFMLLNNQGKGGSGPADNVTPVPSQSEPTDNKPQQQTWVLP